MPEQRMRIRIWQQNLNKSLIAQLDMLNMLDPAEIDIIALQEPHIDFLGNSRANPHWTPIYPCKHRDDPHKTRSIMLVNRRISTNAWTHIPLDSPDLTAIRMQ